MTERTEVHRSTDRTDHTRQALLDQLAHLGDEARALKRHLDLIPTPVLEGRPFEGSPSFKEIYGLIALFDERVYGPAVSRLSDEEGMAVELPRPEDLLRQSPCDDVEMDALLDRVTSARIHLVALLEELPPGAWHREVRVDGDRTDVFGLAYGIVQHDADRLQEAAYRLHESRLTSREDDLPK